MNWSGMDRMSDDITADPNIANLKAAALGAGMVSLIDHARSLITSGVTSIDECHRVIGLE